MKKKEIIKLQEQELKQVRQSALAIINQLIAVGKKLKTERDALQQDVEYLKGVIKQQEVGFVETTHDNECDEDIETLLSIIVIQDELLAKCGINLPNIFEAMDEKE